MIPAACGDLPTEANGPPPTSSTGAESSTEATTSGEPDPDSTAAPMMTTASDASSSGLPPDETTTNGVTAGTTDGDSSSDTGVPRPLCRDGLVAPGELCHALGPSITVMPGPSRLAVADLDADGADDLFTSNSASTQILALWGVGDGNFIAPQLLVDTAAMVDDLLLRDFSNDGLPDLVVTNRTSSAVMSYANTGLGGVVFAGLYPVGIQPTRMTSGFVDGGAVPDIVVTSGSSTGRVLLGNGFGGFGMAMQPLTLPSGPYTLALRDLDGDGDEDLVSSNQSGGNTTCWLNNAGTLGAAVDHDTDPNPVTLALGDVDEDGDLDVLTVHPAADSVGLLRGDGLGGLGPPEETFMVADDPRGVALADLDSDGRLDLVVIHTTPGLVVIHSGQGDGTFVEGPSFMVPSASVMIVADLNADTVPDVAIGSLMTNAVQALLSDP